MSYKTEQEAFWAGQFGDEYVERNTGNIMRAAAHWRMMLRNCSPLHTVVELGANRGINLQGIRRLYPDVTATAVEINKHACRYLQRIPGLEIVNKSILEYNPSKKYDLAFTRGVLIHINPEELNHVYDLLWSCSSKYICIAEYYNPEPEQVSYRGHVGKLFKRDFAGEFMDRHSQCRLIDYGFIYHRDPQWPADDITWFMLKKTIHICEK